MEFLKVIYKRFLICSLVASTSWSIEAASFIRELVRDLAIPMTADYAASYVDETVGVVATYQVGERSVTVGTKNTGLASWYGRVSYYGVLRPVLIGGVAYGVSALCRVKDPAEIGALAWGGCSLKGLWSAGHALRNSFSYPEKPQNVPIPIGVSKDPVGYSLRMR